MTDAQAIVALQHQLDLQFTILMIYITVVSMAIIFGLAATRQK